MEIILKNGVKKIQQAGLEKTEIIHAYLCGPLVMKFMIHIWIQV